VQIARPTVCGESQQGFETYLAAAILKKNVPVDVVTDQTRANFLFRAAPVEIRSESPAAKRTNVGFDVLVLIKY
jgi:hypothetical protein